MAIQKASASATVSAWRKIHNQKAKRSYAYGSKIQKGICGQNSTKDTKCNGGDWKNCGSNTYPAGYFPDCKSSLGVFDQHGNAAEHMNLPLKKSKWLAWEVKNLDIQK